MKVKAAVLREYKQPLKIEEVELRKPQAGEVLVKVKASGICHTDISVRDGAAPIAPPVILGHEGAGEVIEIGEGVTSVKIGDRVILNNIPECGTCKHCKHSLSNLCIKTGFTEQRKDNPFESEDYSFKSPFSFVSENRNKLNVMFGGPATFATHCVVPENYVCPFPDSIPFEEAALFGCAITTGYGATAYATQVFEESTVLVIGIGAIGLNAIQGAKIAGASTIIACDINTKKESFARQFGATHFILSENGNEKAIADQFDTSGSIPILEMAIQLTHVFSGVCVAIGIKPQDLNLNIPASSFVVGRTLRGLYNGNSKPISAEKHLIDLYAQKKLQIAPLITHRISLDEINKGLELLEKGEAVRVVVTFD